MGRKRTNRHDLPPRMHEKGGTYYHVSTTAPRKWTSLGRDKVLAMRRWAELEGEVAPSRDCTFNAVGMRYMREVVPGKATLTQRDNWREFENLNKVFSQVPIDDIKPHHVRQYLDVRGAKSETRANREKALLSHLFNHARAWGYTEKTNPCAGVKGFKEKGRDRYIEDEEFLAVWEKAHFTVQDAMDIAYRTGQRPSDVIKIKRADIRAGVLYIVQGKTGAKVPIEIKGKLAEVVERILARQHRITGLNLILDEDGQPLSMTALRSRFGKARRLAGVDFQFRDIRAKTATDCGDLARAQKLLGHKNRLMTETYTRDRIGELVSPLEKEL
ncbi:MAG: tyrosine-type recombinase/integrase [Pseudomonadota bacterium]